MKKKLWIKISVMLAIIVAILIVDLVTKYIFDASLAGGETINVIPYLFNFKLVHNVGAAWGILAGKQLFLIVLSLVFLSIFIYYFVKEANKTWLLTVCMAFLFAGCIGNLFDRVVFGYVRDFIQFDFWQTFPIFNFADVFLCFGVLLFIIYLIIYFVKANKNKVAIEGKGNKDKTRQTKKKTKSTEDQNLNTEVEKEENSSEDENL